jgi:PAS domain S-box-containing protein
MSNRGVVPIKPSNEAEETKQNDELLRLLVENVQDYAIFVLDPNGHVLTWNLGAKALKGYERHEIIGKHFSIFYPPDAIESHWPDHELSMAAKEGKYVDEGWRVRRDGSTFWAYVVITALRDSTNKLTGFAKITRDMTEQRIAAERIQGLNRELRKRVSELDESRRAVELRTLDLQNLSARVMQIQDEERRRIARNLHDDVGQQLTGLKMALGNHANHETIEILNSVISSVRNLSYLLHPPLLDETGLRSALHWLVDGMKSRSNIDIALSVRPTDFPRLHIDLETAIFRIVQESLMNIYRHAQSETARIEIDKRAEWVHVRVRDYGKGLPADASALRLGVGIGGMRERVRQFGGELTISNAEPGTVVEAKLPLFS